MLRLSVKDLKKGMIAGCVFPLVLIVSVAGLKIKAGKKS